MARDVVGALHSVTDRKAVKRVQLGGLVLILGVLQATRSGKRTSLKKKKIWKEDCHGLLISHNANTTAVPKILMQINKQEAELWVLAGANNLGHLFREQSNIVI